MERAYLPKGDDPDFWPHVYREAVREAHLIDKQRERIKKDKELRQALWSGWYAVNKSAKDALNHAVKDGQLLRCY